MPADDDARRAPSAADHPEPAEHYDLPEQKWSAQQRAAAARLMPPRGGVPSLDRLAELARRMLGVEVAQASLLIDMQVVASSAGRSADARGRRSSLSDSFCVVAATDGAPLIVPDALANPRVSSRGPATSGEIGAYLGIPMIDDSGTAVGALCVFNAKPRAWRAADIEALTHLTRAAVAELELAALTREYDSDRARWELAVSASDLGTFTRDLGTGEVIFDDRMAELYGFRPGDPAFDRAPTTVRSRIHPDDVGRVDTAMAQAVGALGPLHLTYRIILPPAGRVRWLEARGRVLPGNAAEPPRLLGVAWDVTQAQHGQARADRVLDAMPVGFLALDADWRITAVNPEGAALSGSRAELMTGRVLWELYPALLGTDAAATYHRVAATGVAETIETYYPAPLDRWFEVRVTSEWAGVSLYFVDVTARRADQLRLTESARHDRTVAQTLQSVLLTELPHPEHLSLAARYLTAAEADEIGGDWFDAVVHDDSSVTVVVGDVVGHDIRAAAAMGQLRAMLRAFAWADPDAGSTLLARLDRAGRDLGSGVMATVAVGRLRYDPGGGGPASWSFSWSNAGHLPPVVVHPDGRVEVLTGDRTDPMLGVVPDAVRHDHERALPVGSTLLLYTDGLVETRHEDIDAGIDRFGAALTRHHRLSTEDMLDLVLGDMVGERPGDDAAVLAIRLGSPADDAAAAAREPDLVLELPSDPTAAGVARAAVRGCSTHLAPGPQDDAGLLVSELVTNAVRYGMPTVTVRVWRWTSGIKVSVHDHADIVPNMSRVAPGPDQPNGRGLLIVDAIATARGITTAPPPGKAVWFEIGPR